VKGEASVSGDEWSERGIEQLLWLLSWNNSSLCSEYSSYDKFHITNSGFQSKIIFYEVFKPGYLRIVLG
jgi:hypothetical protein